MGQIGPLIALFFIANIFRLKISTFFTGVWVRCEVWSPRNGSMIERDLVKSEITHQYRTDWAQWRLLTQSVDVLCFNYWVK